MADIQATTDSEGTGRRYLLGASDTLHIQAGVLVHQTDYAPLGEGAVVGYHDANDVSVSGKLLGVSNALYLSSSSASSSASASVTVGQQGSIVSEKAAAITFANFPGSVSNAGRIDGDVGISFTSSGAAAPLSSSTINNQLDAVIAGNSIGISIDAFSGSSFTINNNGLISGKMAVVGPVFGSGSIVIKNSGKIFGDVNLGGGDDKYTSVSTGVIFGYISAGKGKDELYGLTEDNVFYGDDGDDLLSGGGGSDKLHGGSGSDELDGGEGQDTALFDGNRADYSVRFVGAGTWMVRNGDDEDELQRIEKLSFEDGLVDVATLGGRAPTLSRPIEDQVAPDAGEWVFTVPKGTFIDADSDVLELSASVASGGALPGWLKFDASTGAFKGLPPAGFSDPLSIKVTAFDGSKTASDTFTFSPRPNVAGVIITSNGGQADATVTITENSLIASALAARADGGRTVTWSIAGGSDAHLFSIEHDLVFSTAPDFEAALDADEDNTYEVIVAASDGVTTDTQRLAINIANLPGRTKNGSAEANKLNGTQEEDVLNGRGGKDTLKGIGGDDTLNGGSGADRLYGGLGADWFVYGTKSDSSAKSSRRDTIYDFRHEDVVDLRAVDASSKKGGNQAFKWIGADKFHGKAGELRYDKKKSDTYIYGDTNGDKKADFSVHLDDAVKLVKADFLL